MFARIFLLFWLAMALIVGASIAITYTNAAREFERQDFSAACGVIGHFVIEEFRHARLELPPFLAWRRANCPDRPLAHDLLADYARVDPLDYVQAAYRPGWAQPRAGG